MMDRPDYLIELVDDAIAAAESRLDYLTDDDADYALCEQAEHVLYRARMAKEELSDILKQKRPAHGEPRRK